MLQFFIGALSDGCITLFWCLSFGIMGVVMCVEKRRTLLDAYVGLLSVALLACVVLSVAGCFVCSFFHVQIYAILDAAHFGHVKNHIGFLIVGAVLALCLVWMGFKWHQMDKRSRDV